jgi:hypothetical protein
MSDRERSEQESVQRSGHARLIMQAKQEAFHARRKVRRELPSPSMETKRALADALADYRDVLWDYREESALSTDWDGREVNVDRIDTYLEGTVEVEAAGDWRGRSQSATAPAVAKVPPRHLIEIGKELDAIAKELGFAAKAKHNAEMDEADMSDLRGLLKARGQSKALENLPDVDDADPPGVEVDD